MFSKYTKTRGFHMTLLYMCIIALCLLWTSQECPKWTVEGMCERQQTRKDSAILNIFINFIIKHLKINKNITQKNWPDPEFIPLWQKSWSGYFLLSTTWSYFLDAALSVVAWFTLSLLIPRHPLCPVSP